MSLQERFREWLRLYLLAISTSLLVIVFGAFLFAVLMNRPFLDVLGMALLFGALILIGVGVVSILPLSEFSYTTPYGRGRAGANPVIIREGIRHMKRKREPRKMGMLLGIVGLTLLLIYFVYIQ